MTSRTRTCTSRTASRARLARTSAGFRPDLARPAFSTADAGRAGVDPVRPAAAGLLDSLRETGAHQQVTASRSHRRAAVSPCRGNGRFPYTETTGQPAKIIASASGCTDLASTEGLALQAGPAGVASATPARVTGTV
jgi:hypothetical protein